MDSDQIPPSTDQNSPRLFPSSAQNPPSVGMNKTPFKAPSTNPVPKNSFLHLWELESKYLCALVGTCATIPEIRKLAHKSRIDNPDQYTDYHLHNIFVNAAHDGTRPGRLLEKYFDKNSNRQLLGSRKHTILNTKRSGRTHYKAVI